MPFTKQVKTTLRLRRGTRKPTAAKDRLLRFAACPWRRPGEQVPRPPPRPCPALRAFRRVGHEKPRGITKTAAARPARKERLPSQYCDSLISCLFVSGEARFVSGVAEAPPGARQRRGHARGLAHRRMGGPCRTAAQPPSAIAGFRVPRGAPVPYGMRSSTALFGSKHQTSAPLRLCARKQWDAAGQK